MTRDFCPGVRGASNFSRSRLQLLQFALLTATTDCRGSDVMHKEFEALDPRCYVLELGDGLRARGS